MAVTMRRSKGWGCMHLITNVKIPELLSFVRQQYSTGEVLLIRGEKKKTSRETKTEHKLLILVLWGHSCEVHGVLGSTTCQLAVVQEM